jgi:hypothetical protein
MKVKAQQISLVTKGLALMGLGASLMGNQSCQSTPARTMSRRVLVGQMSAPTITLPASLSNQTFNFGYVANQQLASILGTTKSFSTANMDPNMTFTPAGLDADITNNFQQCDDSSSTVSIQTITPAAISASGLDEIATQTNSCVINLPQAVISGGITDFTLKAGGGLSLSLAGISALPSISFAFQDYTLNLEMGAFKPLDPGHNTFVSTITSSSGYSGSLSATISFDGLTLGPSGYYNTPLSNIVQNGLTSAVTEIATNWNTQDPWYTTVLKACGTYIYVNGSTDLGLEVGDILAVKNVTYIWQGAVCDSASLGDVPDVTPVDYAQIVSLGDNIAVAQVIKGNTAYPQANNTTYAGARVYMHQTSEQVKAAQQTAKAGTTTGVCQLPVGTCGTAATTASN